MLFHNGIDTAEYCVYILIGTHRVTRRSLQSRHLHLPYFSVLHNDAREAGCLRAEEDHGGSDTGRPARAGRRRASVTKETRPPMGGSLMEALCRLKERGPWS